MSQPWKLNTGARRSIGSRLARSPQCRYVVASRPSLGRYRLLEPVEPGKAGEPSAKMGNEHSDLK